MQEEESIQTITEMRRAEPDAKIIAISGGGRVGKTDFLKMARSLGAMDVVSKPFDPDELLTVVEYCLAGRAVGSNSGQPALLSARRHFSLERQLGCSLGIPWYRREDWHALLALLVDAKRLLPATYDKWLRRAEQTEKKFKRQGTIAERVYIDPIEFSLWCVDRGTDLDAAVRMDFAAEAVTRKYRSQS
jgi:CheY-like chemotaxis protein